MIRHLSCGLGLLMLAASCFASSYNVLLNVVNKTGKAGYFGVCAQTVTPGGATLCSIPQKIQPGFNRIFVPNYKTAYPFFTTLDEKAYTCGSQANPQQQFFIPIAKGTSTVVLNFITDKDGKKVAMDCVTQ
ncbi:MAG: hypothetical protein PVG30_04315 [Gammaproteobacteria bacterium]|jgi:hypothetical protein